MEITQLRFKLEGVSPLLMDNPAALALTAGPRGPKPRPIGGEDTVDVEAEKRAYRSEEGNLQFPAQAFRKTMLEAAEAHKIPRSRQNMSTLLAHVEIVPEEYVTLCGPDGEPLLEYTVDGRRCVNPSTGGAIWVSRPKLPYWQTTFTFLVDSELVGDPEAMVVPIMADAGRRVGVGPFRPRPPKTSKTGKGGWFGRFQILEVEVLSSWRGDAKPSIAARSIA